MNTCSFVVPTRNESAHIAKCLDSIRMNMAAIADIKFEIVVIDNNSTDNTVDIVREYTLTNNNIRLLSGVPENINVSELRNMAVAVTTGDVLFFIDGDVVLADDWYTHLDEIFNILKNNPKTILGKHYGYSPDSSWITKLWYAPELLTSTYIPAGHMIMLKSRFFQIGQFDKNLETGEDTELCRRNVSMNGAIHSFDDLETYHLGYPDTIKDFFNRERWHGKGNWYPFPNIVETNMGRLLGINALAYISCLAFIFISLWPFIWAVGLTLATALLLGYKRSNGIAKYIPACVSLSLVLLFARLISLVDVLRSKDSYLIRKG